MVAMALAEQQQTARLLERRPELCKSIGRVAEAAGTTVTATKSVLGAVRASESFAATACEVLHPHAVLYDGTELRAVAGNFLFSTGANEFAGRYTAGHFDLPMMGTTIELDGVAVVREGVLQDVFG